MKLIWLGHSAFRVELGEAIILIDPFLRGNSKFTGDFAAATEGATHIVLTHGHDDHIGDAAEIAVASGAEVVSNYEICMFLQSQGAANINPGNTGGAIDCGAFSVSLTQALHSSGTVFNGQSIYLGSPNGVVIKPRQGPTLYHMGDTDIFSDMALIDEIHQPKIGLVPVGDRFTMSGATAALAVRRFFSFETVVPCHYGTFDLLSPDPSAFVAAMQGAPTQIAALQIGESLAL
ncbi:metal-dependent hydrolase [Methylocapsa acidiphila]|uniref:metal-dependent hydrolase n=1 Tax=Methylocapsa acidiphila TaxID=133552 RepID=UPI00047A4F07|nr:metal-dependent hydrolase [Methylocapsa acidiphila]